MTGPPAGRPNTQEARGGYPGASQQARNANYVRILNPIPDAQPKIKRKLAEKWVRIGRAKWKVDKVHGETIELLDHPENKEAEQRAAERRLLREENERCCSVAWSNRSHSPQELLYIGIVRPNKAITENLTVRTTVTRHFAGRSGPVKQLPSDSIRRIASIDEGSITGAQTDSLLINAVAAGKRSRAASLARTQAPDGIPDCRSELTVASVRSTV